MNEEDRLQSLYNLNILDSGRSDRYDRITRMAQTLLEVPIALVSLVDRDRQWFKSCQGLNTYQTSRSVSFCSYAILDESIFLIPDAIQDSRFANNALVTGPPYIRFYAGRPINSPEHYRIGTLCIIDNKPRTLSLGDKKILNDLAEWVENEIHIEHLSKKLLETNKLLTETIETNKELVAVINHDIVNALGPVVSYTSLMLQDSKYDESTMEYLQSISTAGELLSRLATDILDIYKLDLHTFQIIKDNVSCRKFVKYVKNYFNSLESKHKKGVSLTVNLNYKGKILCDKRRIEQVFNNLITNAYDFVPSKKGQITISIISEDKSNDIIFTIDDNGPGIPKENMDKLFIKFNKFYNPLKIKRNYGGSGLGLAISKNIIQLHGGKIWLDLTKVEKGCCFKFQIPLGKENK